MLCSSYFIVITTELKGITALLIVPKVNYTDQTVTSTFLGISKDISEALSLRIGTAKYLGPAFGCSLTMETFKKSPEFYDFNTMQGFVTEDVSTGSKSSCDVVDETNGACKADQLASSNTDHFNIDCFNSVLDTEFGEAGFLKNQSRAIVVSHDSQIIAERYQQLLGITHETRLLGWSMTKSLFSAIIGVAIEQGLVTLDTPAKLGHLKPAQRERLIEKTNGEAITFRHLLQMYDILGFVEDYSPMKDVVFMLYGTYETVKFSSSRQTFSDANRSPGDGWYYSSAVSNLLSEELRGLFSSDIEYWEFPRKYLFSKIGAHSFAIEMDAKGVFVASSFGYAVSSFEYRSYRIVQLLFHLN